MLSDCGATFAPEEKRRRKKKNDLSTISQIPTVRDAGDFSSTGRPTLGSFETIKTGPHPLSCGEPAGLVVLLDAPLS
jgi:hypothetical protein